MSSFLVSDFHVNTLVRWAEYHGVRYYFRAEGAQSATWHEVAADPQRVAELLHAANVRGVGARYGEDGDGPGFTYRRVIVQPWPVQIVKACHCLAYQCCDAPEWDTTEACAVLEAIERQAVRKLPGYGSAAWELRP